MESVSSAIIAFWVLLLVTFSCLDSSEALSSNNGNVTIKWDLLVWTPDGYVAVVTAYNYQRRPIRRPGWTMSWTWSKKEVIWSMIGAMTTEQGDCSRFKSNIPHSCITKPTVVDLLPGIPFNQQIANCCTGGVLKPGSAAAFQISVGNAGTSTKLVRMPVKFLFTAPKQQYICGPAKNVRPTRFITADKRRITSALMTWNVTCIFHKTT